MLYLNYGPYSSYAPHYDSTFANISKDDSDLIYSTYGEDGCDIASDFRRVPAQCPERQGFLSAGLSGEGLRAGSGLEVDGGS